MIPARESSDPYARYAHHILDRVKSGGKVSLMLTDWALVYLNEKDGDASIPDTARGYARRNRQKLPSCQSD